MKKIAKSVIILVIINIILNLIINVVKYLLNVEINEIVAYIIYFLENIIILVIGVKILWQKFNVETVKKIVYIFTAVLVIYNIFSVAMAMTQYEEYFSRASSRNNIMNYSSSSETMNGQETIEEAIKATQQEMEEEKNDYYALLIRSNVVIYNIIIIVLYCFIAPKWFEAQKKEVVQNNKYDFYKE